MTNECTDNLPFRAVAKPRLGRCVANTAQPPHSSQCTNAGHLDHAGLKWCGLHHPPSVAERKASKSLTHPVYSEDGSITLPSKPLRSSWKNWLRHELRRVEWLRRARERDASVISEHQEEIERLKSALSKSEQLAMRLAERIDELLAPSGVNAASPAAPSDMSAQGLIDPPQHASTESATYTVDEAAALLGIGRNQAYEAARVGQLPILKIGKRLLIPKNLLNAMLRGEK